MAEDNNEEQQWLPPGIQLDRPSVARIYDYMLGGYHNFEIDRTTYESFARILPDFALTAQINRAFLRRACCFGHIESDSKLIEYSQFLARCRVTRLMCAMRIQASALAMDFSQSFDRRRHRFSQAKVRSTTHRRGRTSNPSAVSERLTIWTVHRPRAFSASRSLGPAYPPSANTCRNDG